MFSTVVKALIQKVSRSLRQESSELMYLLDSTSVTLKGREFDRWTLENRNRRTQGIKLHVLYDADASIPVWQEFSAANVNDINMAVNVQIEPSALYVFDKGYTDYSWWHAINVAKARFVTRFKNNAALQVERKLDIPSDAAGVVLCDEVVTFKRKCPGGKRIKRYYGNALRRVSVARPD